MTGRLRTLAHVAVVALVSASIGCSDSWFRFGITKQVRGAIRAFEVPTAPIEVVVDPDAIARLVERFPVPSETNEACTSALADAIACTCDAEDESILCCDLDRLDAALEGACGVEAGLELRDGSGDVLLDWLVDETESALDAQNFEAESTIVLYDLSAYRTHAFDYARGDLDEAIRAMVRDVPVHVRIVTRADDMSELFGDDLASLRELIDRPELVSLTLDELVLRTLTEEELDAEIASTEKEPPLDPSGTICTDGPAREPWLQLTTRARVGACYEIDDGVTPIREGWPLRDDGSIDIDAIGSCVPSADDETASPVPGVHGAVLSNGAVDAAVDDCAVTIDRPTGVSITEFFREDVRNLDLVVDVEGPLPFRDPGRAPCEDDPSRTCFVPRKVGLGGFVWMRVVLDGVDERTIAALLDAN